MRAIAVVAALLASCGGGGAPRYAVRVAYDVDGDPAADAAVMQRRLGTLGVAGEARVEGGHVIVDLPTLAPDELAMTKDVVSRSGHFEIHACDDAADVVAAIAARAQGAAGIVALADGLAADDAAGDTGRHLLGVYLAAVPVPPDHLFLFEKQGSRWRTHYVVRAPIVANGAVRASSADGATVTITLDDPAAAALADWTRAHVGSHVVVVLDDRVLAAPVVDDPIVSGRVSLHAADAASAAQLAHVLDAGPLPAPVLELSTPSLP